MSRYNLENIDRRETWKVQGVIYLIDIKSKRNREDKYN